MNTEQRLQLIEAFIASLKSSNSIPIDIDQSFTDRFLRGSLKTTGIGSATTQNINLTGNAQTIVVPAQPTGTVKVTINGTVYELLYK